METPSKTRPEVDQLVPPRLNKTCSDPTSLPIYESFAPSQTVIMFSLPFHVPKGTNIAVKISGKLDDASDSPALATVGVRVRQCCEVSDSDITEDTFGKVGQDWVATRLGVRLTDNCDLATKFGDDCVYYLRLRIDSSENVLLAYSVDIVT